MTSATGIGASGSGATAAAAGADTTSAFRNADFLKIMLSEITNQDPLNPQETSKLVENVQQLQQLANTTYQKYRSDVSWGQQLMDQTVSVQQQPLSENEKQALVDKGLNPDVGYGAVTGKVTSFRAVNQAIYVKVNGHDYPLDNVKQVIPKSQDSQYLATMASQLLGRTVTYPDATGSLANGKVSAVDFDKQSNLMLQVGSEQVPFSSVTQIAN